VTIEGGDRWLSPTETLNTHLQFHEAMKLYGGPWMRVSAQRSPQSSTGIAEPRGMKRVSKL
jgi:hypothetical protein